MIFYIRKLVMLAPNEQTLYFIFLYVCVFNENLQVITYNTRTYDRIEKYCISNACLLLTFKQTKYNNMTLFKNIFLNTFMYLKSFTNKLSNSTFLR